MSFLCVFEEALSVIAIVIQQNFQKNNKNCIDFFYISDDIKTSFKKTS